MDFNSLRNAASTAVDKVTAAARGLRMPGVGAPQPAAAAAGTTPLPQIDPSLADRAQVTMRAPVAPQPPIPTLTDEIRPGVAGPFQPEPPIPTLSDVHTAGTVNPPPFQPAPGVGANPNVPAGGMSAERAAFNAARAGGSGAPPSSPTGPEAWGRAAGKAVRATGAELPTLRSGAANGIMAALPFVSHWDAFKGNYDDDAAFKAQLFARDTMRSAAGTVGGLTLGSIGATAGSAVPVAGTIAGGAAGAYFGQQAGDLAADHLADSIRRGANWVNEKLGGSPDYFEDTDVGLRKRGFNPNATAFDTIAAKWRGEHPAAPTAPVVKAPGAATTPVAPIVPADVAAFNDRMKQVGADSVGMRVGPGDTRVLANTAPASADLQRYTDQHMAQRTAQLEAADQSYREQAARQHAQNLIMQDPDVMRLTDELQAAERSGSPAAIQAASNARDNLIRTKSGDRQNDQQANVTMRGQDFTLAGQRATNQLGMYNAMREQGNVNREYQRNVTNDQFTQGEAAEKHLDDALTARFTTGVDKNGAPQVDVAAKNAALVGIQRSAAALGVDSIKDLSKPDRERLIAGADLASKVNADASNILPWKPDVIGEVMPHDLIGLQKNSSGDYVIPRGAAKGRVIPARYLNKVGADRIGGQPTDIYDNLKAQ
jgi:hypothetical protein